MARAARRGNSRGALVLFHGRGADERDLYPLLDALDPSGGCSGSRRAARWRCRPAARTGTGRGHPYSRPGHVLPELRGDGALLDGLPVPIERVVIGGFSQGAVMSWALGLGAGRPRPAAIIALSGFMPEVEGFELDLSDLNGYPVAVAHGSLDPVIPVEFGRAAAERVRAAGADLLWPRRRCPTRSILACCPSCRVRRLRRAERLGYSRDEQGVRRTSPHPTASEKD